MMKNTIRELKTPIAIVFLVYLMFFVVNIYVMSQNSLTPLKMALWIYASDMIDFFFPLIITAPFVWIIYVRQKSRFNEYISVRVSLTKYLVKQILSLMIIVFIITSLVNLLAALITLYCIQPSNLDLSFGYDLPFLPFRIRLTSSIGFAIFASLWKGIIASILILSSSLIAYSVNNLFVSLFSIYAYVLIENLLTGTIGIAQYSLITSISLGRLNDEQYTIFNLFVGPLNLLVFSFIFMFIINKYVRNNND